MGLSAQTHSELRNSKNLGSYINFVIIIYGSGTVYYTFVSTNSFIMFPICVLAIVDTIVLERL